MRGEQAENKVNEESLAYKLVAYKDASKAVLRFDTDTDKKTRAMVNR